MRNGIGGAPVFNWHEIRRRRKSEGGQKFLPPNPLPFCPPERKSFSKFSVRIFAKKSSDFVQRSEDQGKAIDKLFDPLIMTDGFPEPDKVLSGNAFYEMLRDAKIIGNSRCGRLKGWVILRLFTYPIPKEKLKASDTYSCFGRFKNGNIGYYLVTGRYPNE